MKVKFLLLTLGWLPIFMFSQNTCCLPYDHPINELSYQDRGGYCEGLLGRQVGVKKGQLEMVNFTYGELNYSKEKAEIIPVSTNVDCFDGIKIEATGVPCDLFYRLDACISSRDTLKWNTGTVLIREARTKHSRYVGVVGKHDNVFIPLIVGTSPERSNLTMFFTCNKKIARVRWKLLKHQTQYSCIENCRTFRKDQTILIPLPIDLKPGPYELEVQGIDPTFPASAPITRKIKFRI